MDTAPRLPPLHRLHGFDYSDPDHAYFITICTQNRSSPFTDDRLAREVVSSLTWLRTHRHIALYAFCLMPDHIHLLLRLPPGSPPLGEIVKMFKTFTTRQSWRLGYQGTLWQRQYYDHILRRSEDGAGIAAYIRANPVRKGLVEEESEWQWSGFPDPM